MSGEQRRWRPPAAVRFIHQTYAVAGYAARAAVNVTLLPRRAVVYYCQRHNATYVVLMASVCRR